MRRRLVYWGLIFFLQGDLFWLNRRFAKIYRYHGRFVRQMMMIALMCCRWRIVLIQRLADIAHRKMSFGKIGRIGQLVLLLRSKHAWVIQFKRNLTPRLFLLSTVSLILIIYLFRLICMHLWWIVCRVDIRLLEATWNYIILSVSQFFNSIHKRRVSFTKTAKRFATILENRFEIVSWFFTKRAP